MTQRKSSAGGSGKKPESDIEKEKRAKEREKAAKKAAKAAIPKPATPVAQRMLDSSQFPVEANFVDEAVDGEKESRMQFDQQVKREIPHAYLSEEVNVVLFRRSEL